MVNKTIKKLNQVLMKYNLEKINNIELLNSNQNKVYKVETINDTYIIKEFSEDTISNYYYLQKRKEQIRISKKLNEYGIKTVIPLEYKNKNFIFLNNQYYLIYNFYEEKPIEYQKLTNRHIKVLAKTQSKIHKINVKNNLKCSYRYIKIDLSKQLKIAKNVSEKLYKTLDDNKDILDNLINNCNKKLKLFKNNLCISHNDYKLLNILWKNEDLILIDFDALGLSNPVCSLCESAYTFSYNNKIINYEVYKEYLKSYINDYGNFKENYQDALYVSVNGKLQWLQYMFSKNHLKNNNYIDDTINMIKELIIYYKNIDKFNDIYIEVVQQK